MGLVGRDVNRIHRSERKFPISDLYAAAAAYADHDMRVVMALQAGEAACFEFKVAHMELHLLPELSNQDLARCPAKLAAPIGGELVWLQLDTGPSKAPLKPPQDRRIPGLVMAHLLARHGLNRGRTTTARRRWRR